MTYDRVEHAGHGRWTERGHHARRWCGALLAAGFLYASPAAAATMYYLDVPALVAGADVVVVGEVVGAEVFVGNFSRITTRWTVRVERTLKGSAPGTVAFTQWAGELDGVAERVPGDAVVRVGQRAVFFLSGDAPHDLVLSALGQSKFEIGDPVAVLSGDPGGSVVPSLVESWFGDVAPRLSPWHDDAPVWRDFADISLFMHTPEGPREVSGRIEAMTLGALIDAVQAAAGVGR